MRRWSGLFSLVVVLGTVQVVRGDVTFSVFIDDPGGCCTAFHDDIESNLLAAGSLWAAHLDGDALLEIIVEFTFDIPRMTGGSLTSVYVYNNGSFNVFEQGAAGA